MRPIGTAEGTGLEELSRDLTGRTVAPSRAGPRAAGGLEEDGLVLQIRGSAKKVRQWANEAERVIGYLSGRRSRGHVPQWDSFGALLEKAAQVERETPWDRPADELLQQAFEELRYFLDFLATLKMQMLLLRHLPIEWTPGLEIPDEAAADLEELYIQEAGLRLMRKPPPDELHVRTMRHLQAQAVMILSSSGRMKNSEAVRAIITDKMVQAGDAFGLLHDLEVGEYRRLSGTGVASPAELKRHGSRALGYALLQVVRFPVNLYPEKMYDRAVDVLGNYIVPVPEDGAGAATHRRKAIRNAISLYLWDAVDRRYGQVPEEVVSAALKGDDTTLLEVAMHAARILSVAAETERAREDLSQLAEQYQKRLEEEHPAYARALLNRRMTLRPPRLGRDELEKVLPYSEAVRLASGPAGRLLLTFDDQDRGFLPGGYVEVGPEGILIPYDHFALSSGDGGIRVIDLTSLSTAYQPPQQSSEWFVSLGTGPRWKFPQPIWELREATGVKVESEFTAERFRAGAISVQLISELGILVRPAQGGRVYLEVVPAELKFESTGQRAQFGQMVERLRKSEKWGQPPLLLDLSATLHLYAGPGVTLVRTPAVVSRQQIFGTQEQTVEFEVGDELYEGEPVEVLDGTGRPWRLIQNKNLFLLKQVGPPLAERLEGKLEPQQPAQTEYALTANLMAEMKPEAWVPDRLRQIVGIIEPGGLPREVLIKLTDGALSIPVKFTYRGDGTLRLETRREWIFGLHKATQLMIRLIALLGEVPSVPAYDAETPIGVLGEALQTRSLEGEEFLRRNAALDALIRRPTDGEEVVRALLEHVKREPAATLTVRALTGFVERHEGGTRLSPSQRREIWEKMADLAGGSASPQVARHPDPWVRLTALQVFARLTPDGRDLDQFLQAGQSRASLRQQIFETADDALQQVEEEDEDPDVRDLADEVRSLLDRQRRFGPADSWKVLPGPAEAGLEETTVVAGVSAEPSLLSEGVNALTLRAYQQIGKGLSAAQALSRSSPWRPAMLPALGPSVSGEAKPHLFIGPADRIRLLRQLHEKREWKEFNTQRLGVLDLYHAIENAVDAVADLADARGKTVRKSVSLSVRRAGEALVLELRDNGIGIPEFMSDLVFRENVTTKEEKTRAGGRGRALAGGLYGFPLLREMKGTMELETLRYNEPGTKEEFREKSWRVVYDGGREAPLSPPAVGERQTIGTRVRWTFPAVFAGAGAQRTGLEERRPTNKEATVGAGRETVSAPEGRRLTGTELKRGLSEEAWRALGITEEDDLFVAPMPQERPALAEAPPRASARPAALRGKMRIFAHADIAASLVGLFPDGQVEIVPLMHPNNQVKRSDAGQTVRAVLEGSPPGPGDLVILNSDYLLGSAGVIDWVPERLLGTVPILALPAAMFRAGLLDRDRLILLRQIAVRIGQPLAILRAEFNLRFENQNVLVLQL